jgi:hydrogenase expression/formation protein HypD
MKYLDEYRGKDAVAFLVEKIRNLDLKKMKIMEVCGSQTHTIMKYGIEELLPDEITLVHGPGCPVCVTSAALIDQAMELVRKDDVILAVYGDMMRVPGSSESMLSLKASGADIRIIYSPLEAVDMAVKEPDRKVILFAIGFETTAPANASALLYAAKLKLKNFFLLSAQVLIPPAVDLIMSSDDVSIDGLLAPGHVCAVTGSRWCEEISRRYKIPVTITGFEPVDILEGIMETAKNISGSFPKAVNQYKRIVTEDGNKEAQDRIRKVYKTVNRDWRGLGIIPQSGFDLKDEYAEYDAVKVFNLKAAQTNENSLCIAGEILQGKKKPDECILFGNKCKPENPSGAPMVSSEGACSAYFRYRRTMV